MAGQAYCTLGGYTFAVNAVEQMSVKKKTVSYTSTLGNSSTVGGYFTVRPRYPQDRDIELSWPFLNYTQYQEFETLANTLTPVAFTDWLGNSYTVIVNNPTNASILRGSTNAYVDVKLKLTVVTGN